MPSNSLGRACLAPHCAVVSEALAAGEGGLPREAGQRRGPGLGRGQPWRRPARGWLVSAGEWSPLWVLLWPCGCPWVHASIPPRPHPGWAQGQALPSDTVLVLVPASSLSAPGGGAFSHYLRVCGLHLVGRLVLPALCSPSVVLQGHRPSPSGSSTCSTRPLWASFCGSRAA